MKVILASSSPRRKRLLEEAGLEAAVVFPSVSEEAPPDSEPEEAASHAARRKCEAVAYLHPEAVVVAADTIVVKEGRILGKPSSLDEAREMLRFLSASEHRVLTAVRIEHRAGGRTASFVERSLVRLGELGPDDIERYTAEVNVLDKAGAYAIQERPDIIGAEVVEGSFTNVVGLPMERLLEALARFEDLERRR